MILDEPVDRLEHDLAHSETWEVLPNIPERLHSIDLSHRVEAGAATPQNQRYVSEGLHSPTEAALCLSHSLGHRPDLAGRSAHECDNSVGFAEPHRP